jgi:type I restriction enzyme S subunit
VNELPRGWASAGLTELCSVIRGVTFRKAEALSTPAEGRIPLITSTQISETGLDLETNLSYVPIDRVSEAQRLKRGDIVVAASSGSSSVVGKSALMTTDWPGTFGAFCSVMRATRGLDPAYLAYYVSSPAVRRAWSALAAGTNINNLKREHFASTIVAVPPLAEQRRIVAAIEEQVSRLDKARDDLSHARSAIGLLRSRILDSISELDAPRTLIGSLVPPTRKIAYGVLQPGPHVPGGLPLVRVGNVADFRVAGELKRIDPAIAARYPRTSLHGGEVLLTVVGTIGRTAVAPAELQGANVARAVAIVPLLEDADPRFVAFALGCPRAARQLTRAAHEVARKTLNLEDVRKFEIPFPPLAKQRETADVIDAALTRIEVLEIATAMAGERSKALRRAILARAFRGELVPQDPNDEPASVLIEGIAAERAAAPKPPRKRRERSSA